VEASEDHVLAGTARTAQHAKDFNIHCFWLAAGKDVHAVAERPAWTWLSGKTPRWRRRAGFEPGERGWVARSRSDGCEEKAPGREERPQEFGRKTGNGFASEEVPRL